MAVTTLKNTTWVWNETPNIAENKEYNIEFNTRKYLSDIFEEFEEIFGYKINTFDDFANIIPSFVRLMMELPEDAVVNSTISFINGDATYYTGYGDTLILDKTPGDNLNSGYELMNYNCSNNEEQEYYLCGTLPEYTGSVIIEYNNETMEYPADVFVESFFNFASGEIYSSINGWGRYWSKKINITGGSDTTNQEAISFIQANATQVIDEPTTADYLQELTNQKKALANNLVEKGVEASESEKFNTLVPKVLDIQSGAKLNIHYGLEAPEDTSKLWVKLASEPNKVEIGNNIDGVGAESIVISETTVANKINGACCGVVGSKCYFFGGYGSSTTNSTSITEYDTISKTSKTKGVFLPSGRANACCGVVGTKIYIFGGQATSSSIYNTTYIYDTETDTITTGKYLPANNYYACCGVVGTKIYIFGGQATSNSWENTIYIYDTETNTITTSSTTLPTNISKACCGVVGSKCYIFGGQTNSTTYRRNTIYIYDTETNTVTTSSTLLPTTQDQMTCGVVGSKCYLFGGYNPDVTNTIYVFDTETNTIQTSSTTLGFKSFFCCGVVGTKIYIFGGPNAKEIQIFSPFSTYEVENGTLFLRNKINTNKVSIIKTDNIDVEIEIDKVLLGNAENVGEEVEALVNKAFTEQQNYYTSSATQLEAGTELTASVECNIGDLVVACIATRDTLSVSEGWELVSTSNVNSTDTYGQRLSWAYTIAEDTTVSITVTQASEQRLYINMVALQGAGDVVDNGYSYRDDATSGSLTVEKPSGLVLWGMTNPLGNAGNKWSSSNGIPVIQIDASLTPRLGLGLDQTEETSVTLEFSNGACPVIVGCLTVEGMSKFYSKYEVYKWEKI